VESAPFIKLTRYPASPIYEIDSSLDTDLNAPSSDSRHPDHLSRQEFEIFLQAFIHEIRNRLNGIALEAADLAEQTTPQADAARLQRQIQECSAFLKTIRELLIPTDPHANGIALADLAKKLQERTPLP
jgi:signal transduction histidine kinase